MANEELVEIQNESAATDDNTEIDTLLENTEKPAEQDYLAAFYEMHGKAVQMGIRDLGKNALQRIIMNVYMGEFAPKQYKPNMKTKTGKLESKIAYHFDEGVYKRMILRFEHEFKLAQEQLAKEQEDLKKIEELNEKALTPEVKAEIDRLQTEAKNESN